MIKEKNEPVTIRSETCYYIPSSLLKIKQRKAETLQQNFNIKDCQVDFSNIIEDKILDMGSKSKGIVCLKKKQP